MLRTAFPDLSWLQARAKEKFNAMGHLSGWPHCVMNARSSEAYRPGIRGPLSLFMNISGFSHCEVEHHRVLIKPDAYYLSNQDQYYTLEIENPEITETLNIHFCEDFLSQVYASLTQRPVDQLSVPYSTPDEIPVFFNQSYQRTPELNQIMKQLLFEMRSGVSRMREDELLTDVLHVLLKEQAQLQAVLARVPAIKSATRNEIFQRLAYAKDYIHTCYAMDMNLDELAEVACLSKYYFLRAFKAVYQMTPYQYLLEVRLEKARELLYKTPLTLTQIAMDTGFDNPVSFSRVFKQKVKCSPSAYRLAKK